MFNTEDWAADLEIDRNQEDPTAGLDFITEIPEELAGHLLECFRQDIEVDWARFTGGLLTQLDKAGVIVTTEKGWKPTIELFHTTWRRESPGCVSMYGCLTTHLNSGE